jgi:signal transduction histidine kinase
MRRTLVLGAAAVTGLAVSTLLGVAHLVGMGWPMWVAGALVVAVATLVADRIAQRLVRSVSELTQAASAIGAGDLETRMRSAGPAELVELRVAFNLMAERMRGHIQSERQLAADVSHRLRTPLTALRLGVAALPEGPESAQVAEVASWLEQEVDAVIDTARRGELVPGQPDCDAALVLRERMDFWSTLAEDEGRQAYYLGPQRGVRVPLARSELGAAVDVLVGNVFRHTPRGTGFRLVLTCPSAVAQVAVEDGGPGFPTAPLLPMAYNTGELPIPSGTTRLGLDIVRRTAKSAHGTVEVGRSSLGGARVAMHLPLSSSEVPRRGRDWRSVARRTPA